MKAIKNSPRPGCSCERCNIRRGELALAERLTKELSCALDHRLGTEWPETADQQ